MPIQSMRMSGLNNMDKDFNAHNRRRRLDLSVYRRRRIACSDMEDDGDGDGKRAIVESDAGDICSAFREPARQMLM